jgi:predicted CopG family antitoxin
MRTTVELSDSVYKQLKSEAVERGIRGFSLIVEEALREHFGSEAQRQGRVEAIRAAKGAWSDEDVEAWEREVKGAWATWQLPQS